MRAAIKRATRQAKASAPLATSTIGGGVMSRRLLSKSGGVPRRLYGRRALLKQIPDLLTQFRAVLVMMNLDRVLNRNFEQFLVRVGRKRHRAIHFARIFATVDEFPSHSILLGRRPLSWDSPDFRRFPPHASVPFA